MTTYEPAICLPLRKVRTDIRLYVIFAADGTPLDTMRLGGLDELPVWVTRLVRLPEVEVPPSVFGDWERNYTALDPEKLT